MNNRICLLAVIGMSLWLSGYGGQKPEPNVSKVPDGRTPAELYELQLAERMAAGEEPPSLMQDPIDDSDDFRSWSLFFCENISEELTTRACDDDPCTVEELVSPAWGVICQNTPAGEQLFELRKWKCAEQADSACICEGKSGRNFDSKQANIDSMGGGKLVGRDGVVATRCRVDE